MNVLASLQQHPSSQRVVFDVGQSRFTIPGNDGVARIRVRGLLRILHRVFRMVEHTPDHCRRCRDAAQNVRRADPLMAASARAMLRPSRKRLRKRHFVPVVQDAETPASMSQVLKCGGATDCAHGTRVDNDISAFVSQGAKAMQDPCAVNIIAHLRNQLKWVPIATQVPMYSTTLEFATAIDLVCTDVETRTKFYVVEIKSTRTHSATPAVLDTCYKTSINTVAGIGLPMSRYMQHQLQLWAMVYVLRTEFAIHIDEAVVIRAGPHFVATYPLNKVLTAREETLVDKMK